MCICTIKLGHIPIAITVHTVIIESSIEMNAAMVLNDPIAAFCLS